MCKRGQHRRVRTIQHNRIHLLRTAEDFRQRTQLFAATAVNLDRPHRFTLRLRQEQRGKVVKGIHIFMPNRNIFHCVGNRSLFFLRELNFCRMFQQQLTKLQHLPWTDLALRHTRHLVIRPKTDNLTNLMLRNVVLPDAP